MLTSLRTGRTHAGVGVRKTGSDQVCHIDFVQYRSVYDQVLTRQKRWQERVVIVRPKFPGKAITRSTAMLKSYHQ